MSKPNGGLGARIRERRMARGLSLRALAKKIKVSPTYLSMIERGVAQPSQARIDTIEKVLRPEKGGEGNA